MARKKLANGLEVEAKPLKAHQAVIDALKDSAEMRAVIDTLIKHIADRSTADGYRYDPEAKIIYIPRMDRDNRARGVVIAATKSARKHNFKTNTLITRLHELQ